MSANVYKEHKNYLHFLKFFIAFLNTHVSIFVRREWFILDRNKPIKGGKVEKSLLYYAADGFSWGTFIIDLNI